MGCLNRGMRKDNINAIDLIYRFSLILFPFEHRFYIKNLQMTIDIDIDIRKSLCLSLHQSQPRSFRIIPCQNLHRRHTPSRPMPTRSHTLP